MFKPALFAVAALTAAPVYADASHPVLQMLDEAIANGNEAEVDTIAKYARKAAPDRLAEIDGKLENFKSTLAAAAKAKADEAAEQKRRDAGNFFKNWTGQGELGGFITGGNADTKGLSAGIALTREGEKLRLNVRGSADYQRSNGVTSNEQFAAAFEPNYKFNERLFAYGLAQWDRDRPQGIDARYLLSGGLGYRAVATDTVTIDLKAGPAWRRTDFTALPSTTGLAGLGSANALWKISPTLTLTEAVNLLWQSPSSSLSSVTALEAKLGGALSARLSYQIRHETNPPAGLEKTDTLSRITLVYGF
jgi:putative salt-induced outer membrane protein